MTKTTRNGRSIVTDINHAPKKTLTSVLGFTDEQAKRMMKARRVLPIVEDRQEPQIDARKLWEKIGKPHKQFNKWADHYINPLMAPDYFGEKSPKICADEIEHFYEHTGKQGRPKTNYLLSRDVAAHLAMQANTAEGHDIRCYFLDMEDGILRLSKHQPERVRSLVQLDNAITHYFRSKAGRMARDEKISKGDIFSVATDNEKLLKRLVCEVLTGHRPSDWREHWKRGIRDVLDVDDLVLYVRCYDMAFTLIKAGKTYKGDLLGILEPTFGGAIDPDKYGLSAPDNEAA
ncbi:antA/AntB antirepressor family protein [Halomonas sp. SL1]|uniref:antA/AntB antirepressor family protein n=1 Tax=Halomonas sp. SL1 TaxID=2137478 RepID=UPI000D161B32|nr:antA/AntB antirepressor family protein [Halomonas sp. SL1]RAH38307.1 hypothetical protein C9J49_007780 [Halomonas sp. SL1]